MVRKKASIRMFVLGISCLASGHFYSIANVAVESKVAIKKPRTSSLIEMKKYIATLLEEHYKKIQLESLAAKEELIAQMSSKSEIVTAQLSSLQEVLENIKTILHKPAESLTVEPVLLPVQEPVMDIDQVQENAQQETGIVENTSPEHSAEAIMLDVLIKSMVNETAAHATNNEVGEAIVDIVDEASDNNRSNESSEINESSESDVLSRDTIGEISSENLASQDDLSMLVS